MWIIPDSAAKWISLQILYQINVKHDQNLISDVHSIVKEPAPPLHKALIMMYNHRWSFRGTVRDSDHALH